MIDPLDRLKDALKDRYLLERELGAGGMATVYLATDLKHDPFLARFRGDPRFEALMDRAREKQREIEA